MKLSKELANHFREVQLNGNWVSTNLKTQLSDVDWKVANTKIGSLNTIADLTYHIHYYVAGQVQVFEGGSLDIRDKFSFDRPPIESQEDWEKLVNKTFKDAEKFANLVEQMSDAKLAEGFVLEEYGNYRRNIYAMIEHSYYHLGQIVLLKKLITEKMIKKHIVFLLFLFLGFQCFAQKDYWKITDRKSIVWDLTKEERLPHKENIEMAGQNVAAILYYEIDENKKLSLSRDVIFPQLRTYNKYDEPDWKKYRAYFRRTISNEISPTILFKNKTINPSFVDSIEIGGMITFYHTPVQGLQIVRTLYPSMTDRFLTEKWEIKNLNSEVKKITINNCDLKQEEIGYKGDYTFQVFSKAKKSVELQPHQSYIFPFYFGATLNKEKINSFDFQKAEQQRIDYLKIMKDNLVLKTPNEIINTLFYFSKIRASESIYNSSLGLIHSPGGGNYYVGIWANDQVEYSGPFFPYLGYNNGNTAALNTYLHFLKNIPTEDTHIPYAFEVDGNFPMTHLDRGDAAMIAYGTAHFALASGDKKLAKQLWPLIEWSLEYCHNHRNSSGAVISESDEMEGRIPTGDANLSTSTLYYGGLKYSQRLAKSIGKRKKARTYNKRLAEMKNVIENYFGGNLEGIDTYKYFKENKHLRHWICLPLSVGITTRKEGTLNALFNKLWMENGILVELSDNLKFKTTFWDRATLYALQGAMKVGATDKAFEKLIYFSQKRLLGDHVPYVVEAYPENNMKHLSAESALYCRIFTEGMLGIEPLSFDKIKLTPSLPKDWDFLELKNMAVLGQSTDIYLKRDGEKIDVKIISNGTEVFDNKVEKLQSVIITLK